MRGIFLAVFLLIPNLALADKLTPITLRAREVVSELTNCLYPLSVPYLEIAQPPRGTLAVYYPSRQTIVTDNPTDDLLYHEVFHHLTARMSQTCRDEIMVEALTILAMKGSL